jgi:OmpA-OmpF porin, OOP family
MRCLAPSRALARRSLLALGLSSSGAILLPHLATAQDAVSSGVQAEAAVSTEPAGPAPVDDEAERHEQLMRRSNTYLGPVGGFFVVEAGSGAPRSLRLSLMSDFFFQKDYLYDDDDTRYLAGSLALSVTPVEHLEISAAVTTRSLRNRGGSSYAFEAGEPEVLQSVGDPYLDVKTYGEVARGVTLGADVMVSFLTAPSDGDLDYAGTTVGLRGALSLDLRRMKAKVPLELRANFGYVFDDSSSVVKESDRERLAVLQESGMSPVGSAEFRHLAPRHERLAFNVNRVDHASLALGLEAPLKLSKRVALHPIAEWELWIPVNRQDFDCAQVLTPAGTKVPGEDSCLADEGADTFPHRIIFGARLYPALQNLSILAAFEYGIGGSTNFVRELAPTAPYRVLVGATYAVDLAPRSTTVVKEVEKRVEVPVAPPEGRVRGTIVEQGAGTPIANARVTFRGTDYNAILTDAEGRFVGYVMAPGDVQVDIDAEGYRSGGCGAKIAEQGGDATVTCELVALPRVGSVAARVVDASGAPVTGVPVVITGPAERTLTADADGRVRDHELPPGDYQVRVDAPGYLIAVTPLHVDLRKETALEVRLTPKPKKSLVSVETAQIKLRGSVFFATDTATIEPRSEPLLAELADVLLRMPEIEKVEVQGHTDNAGAADYNMDLSDRRAKAVREALVRAGVAGDRLMAVGYGSTKQVAPNITAAGRARNRRVELKILQRDGQPVVQPVKGKRAKAPGAKPKAAADAAGAAGTGGAAGAGAAGPTPPPAPARRAAPATAPAPAAPNASPPPPR